MSDVQTIGEFNISFDVAAACFYLLKTGKLDTVGGGFGISKFQLDYVWVLR